MDLSSGLRALYTGGRRVSGISEEVLSAHSGPGEVSERPPAFLTRGAGTIFLHGIFPCSKEDLDHRDLPHSGDYTPRRVGAAAASAMARAG